MAVTINGNKQLVVQVVNATFGTESTTSSTSYVDTGLSANITPASASNTILVIATLYIVQNNGANSAGGVGWRVVGGAGSTVVIDSQGDTNPFDLGQYSTVGWYNQQAVQTKQILHSPNTTSSYTYKVQYRTGTSPSMTINYRGGGATFNPLSSLTLIEVANA